MYYRSDNVGCLEGVALILIALALNALLLAGGVWIVVTVLQAMGGLVNTRLTSQEPL